MHQPVVIGIAGGTASGKTSIAQALQEAFEDHRPVIIRMDDYYKDQSEMVMSERVKTNYDHPFAFDIDLLVKQLNDLIAGKDILQPTYDFKEHTRSKEVKVVHPGDVIIVEGLFVLEEVRLRELCGIKIYVDTDSDIRFIRRLNRDVKERGRTLDSVTSQWTNTVRDMHNLFIEPSKRYADLIIPEGGHNVVAIDLLVTKISSILAQNMIK